MCGMAEADVARLCTSLDKHSCLNTSAGVYVICCKQASNTMTQADLPTLHMLASLLPAQIVRHDANQHACHHVPSPSNGCLEARLMLQSLAWSWLLLAVVSQSTLRRLISFDIGRLCGLT